MERVILYDREGNNPKANYWLTRNRLMREFGWSPDEADKAEAERPDELRIHLKIFELEAERQETENMRAQQ